MLKKNEYWSGIQYFKKSEFDCKCGCKHNNISHDLVNKLSLARDIAEVPFNITSAVRCTNHNKKVKGSSSSSHLKGLAVDIRTTGSSSRFAILEALLLAGFSRIGVYRNFIHVDIDNDKTQNVIWYK